MDKNKETSYPEKEYMITCEYSDTLVRMFYYNKYDVINVLKDSRYSNVRIYERYNYERYQDKKECVEINFKMDDEDKK